MDCEIASALEIAWMLEGKEEKQKKLYELLFQKSVVCGRISGEEREKRKQQGTISFAARFDSTAHK